MELKPETLEQIEAVIPKYPVKRSAVLPLLHYVQADQGYISGESMEWIAEKLEIEPIHVYELVTFYPFFREKPAPGGWSGSAGRFPVHCPAPIKFAKRCKRSWAALWKIPPGTARCRLSSRNAWPVAAQGRWSWWMKFFMKMWTNPEQWPSPRKLKLKSESDRNDHASRRNQSNFKTR